MQIAVADIKASPTEVSFTEDSGELNARLARGAQDYRVSRGLAVDVAYYRSGLDLFFQGSLRGEILGTCARCAEEFPFELDEPFVFVLTPRAAGSGRGQLSADDLALSEYEGEEIDLAPLVYEQAMLGLPTRPLCGEGCLGLCARCGANLNAGPCGCPATTGERRSVLGTLARSK